MLYHTMYVMCESVYVLRTAWVWVCKCLLYYAMCVCMQSALLCNVSTYLYVWNEICEIALKI